MEAFHDPEQYNWFENTPEDDEADRAMAASVPKIDMMGPDPKGKTVIIFLVSIDNLPPEATEDHLRRYCCDFPGVVDSRILITEKNRRGSIITFKVRNFKRLVECMEGLPWPRFLANSVVDCPPDSKKLSAQLYSYSEIPQCTLTNKLALMADKRAIELRFAGNSTDTDGFDGAEKLRLERAAKMTPPSKGNTAMPTLPSETRDELLKKVTPSKLLGLLSFDTYDELRAVSYQSGLSIENCERLAKCRWLSLHWGYACVITNNCCNQETVESIIDSAFAEED